MKRFNNPKYQKLLIRMKGNEYHIEQLAKEINVNTGHLRNVLDDWQKEGIIDRIRKGKEYVIKLSDKGNQIAVKCNELWQIIEDYKPTKQEPIQEELENESE